MWKDREIRVLCEMTKTKIEEEDYMLMNKILNHKSTIPQLTVPFLKSNESHVVLRLR